MQQGQQEQPRTLYKNKKQCQNIRSGLTFVDPSRRQYACPLSARYHSSRSNTLPKIIAKK